MNEADLNLVTSFFDQEKNRAASNPSDISRRALQDVAIPEAALRMPPIAPMPQGPPTSSPGEANPMPLPEISRPPAPQMPDIASPAVQNLQQGFASLNAAAPDRSAPPSFAPSPDGNRPAAPPFIPLPLQHGGQTSRPAHDAMPGRQRAPGSPPSFEDQQPKSKDADIVNLLKEIRDGLRTPKTGQNVPPPHPAVPASMSGRRPFASMLRGKESP